MPHRREHTNEPDPYEVAAYQLGFELEFRRPVTRKRIHRREVHLDSNGQPAALIEEDIYIEEEF